MKKKVNVPKKEKRLTSCTNGRFEREDVSSVYGIQAEAKDKAGVRLFHYTSTDVMDKLLERTTFRASNIFYLNDAAEYRAGIDALYEAVSDVEAEKILKEIEVEDGQGRLSCGVFSISFSQERDSLHQWITYAKESGVAIELDNELINSIQDGVFWQGVDSYDFDKDKEKGENDLLCASLKTVMKPVQYRYDPEFFKQEKILPNRETYMWLASYIKQSAFKSEKEVRIAILACRTEERESKIQYYVMPNGVLRPYLNITIGKISTIDNQFVPMLPLKSITVGPSGKQQVVFDSVVHRVKFGNTRVHNYAEKKELLINNFVLYLCELLIWIEKRSNKNDIIEANRIRVSDNEIPYIENFAWSLPEVNTLKEQIMEQTRKTWHLQSQTKDINQEISEGYSEQQNGFEEGKINKVSVIDIIERVIKNWIEENRRELESIVINDKRVYEEKEIPIEEISDECTEESRRIGQIVYEFSQDVYFTREGILIKKSKIPYIF